MCLSYDSITAKFLNVEEEEEEEDEDWHCPMLPWPLNVSDEAADLHASAAQKSSSLSHAQGPQMWTLALPPACSRQPQYLGSMCKATAT